MRAAIAAVAAALALAPLGAMPAYAQLPAAADRLGVDRKATATLRLYPGVAPGSEGWKQVEVTQGPPGSRMVRNVVTPTLEVYLPDPAKATGAGVVVAPGGANLFLSYDSEGVRVAQWLAEHGAAAFVLKYRTLETPAGEAEFAKTMRDLFARLGSTPAATGVRGLDGTGPATADGVRALQLAREHAPEWKVDPKRIGFMGFSAGARVTVGVVAAGAKPAFAAPIYGGAFGADLNFADAPPMFLAVSVDDTLAAPTVLDLFGKLRQAGKTPELHIYHAGGHGWGMAGHKNTTARWIDEFYWWLQSNGFLKSGR